MWHAWERRVYKVMMGKPKGKKPLERPRHRWEDGIRMDLGDFTSIKVLILERLAGECEVDSTGLG
jgi:hypothetical protein